MDDLVIPIGQSRIIVVDDDRSMRELLQLHLVNAGYEVRLAADAIEAGYMVLECPPDLLIVDIDMPFLSGIDFAAALAADTTLPAVPVILITAHESYEDRAAVLGADYLRKPFKKEDLLRIVERRIGKHPRALLNGVEPPSLGHQASDCVFM